MTKRKVVVRVSTSGRVGERVTAEACLPFKSRSKHVSTQCSFEVRDTKKQAVTAAIATLRRRYPNYRFVIRLGKA